MEQQEYEQKRMSLQTELMELESQEKKNNINDNAFNYWREDDATNLIKWQLDVAPLLEDIKHLLKADVVVFEDGERKWIENKDKDSIPFSENGVNILLTEIYSYLNKNLLLSYYDSKQIDARIFTIGDYLIDFVMDNYEILGMDTEQKMERYSTTMLDVVNAINSAYNRALGGKERDSLTKKTMVHQNLAIDGQHGSSMQKKQGGMLSKIMPWGWFK